MLIILITGSYLIGSISPAFFIAGLKKVNIRNQGTHNPGATNVFKLFGPGWGALTALFDTAKGYLPVLFATEVLGQPEIDAVVIALAAIAGHNWPIFYDFRGGRGLAATIGAVMALVFYPGFIALIVGSILAWIFSKYFKKEIRIPYLSYPLLLMLIIIYYPGFDYIFFALGIMFLSYFRAWQISRSS